MFPDWMVGVLVTGFILFITLTGIFNFTETVELKLFDLRARISAFQEINPDIELVVISDDDLSELGRFPWPRDIIAQGVQNLSAAGARVVALNILFTEPELSKGLDILTELQETFEKSGLAQEGPGAAFNERMFQAIVELDNDSKLYDALKEAKNVVLPVYFDTMGTGTDKKAPDFLFENEFLNIAGGDDESAVASMIWLTKIIPVLPPFAEAATGLGHINLFPDGDGTIRSVVHALGYAVEEAFFPSFPVAIVKAFKGLDIENVALTLGKGIDIKMTPSSVVSIPVADPQMRTYISWNLGPDMVFRQTPFVKVYKNEFQASLFKDKIVIIGPTAAGIGGSYVTPISGHLPGIEILANAVENILNEKFFSRPDWFYKLELGVLLFFGLFVTLVLPRLKAVMGALTTLLLFMCYGIAGTYTFFAYSMWLKIAAPMVLLVLGYILVTSKRFLITEKTKEEVEAHSVETNKMLGLSFQQQGMLDLAFDKFRNIPVGEEGIKDLLYNLGLDFERKRQFSKALDAYKLIIRDGYNFKDLDERIPKLKGAEATMIFGTGGGTHKGDIGITLMDMDTKPTLGRYEVTAELGRGAMGVVYKGVDPKIHRTVAIKTVRLSEFDEEAVDEMKERFFREAESAGLLTHPNIVTIFDAGEEHDLAYIAMEFLEGHDLEQYTNKENLFPIRETLVIVSNVAEALDYAHERDIVHRDIKPANVMRLDKTDEVKVTDFGIARITTSSKTKTGVVLGTPYYMSPEQISGKKVDGRSDIFSLGVMLFELLTGTKPFTGEDLSSLMYKIMHEKQPSAKSINPAVPPVVDKIINKAMAKDVEKRYQKAGQMAEHLKKVAAKIDEVQANKQTRGGKS
jgi:serine/threonine-protein kinase